MTIASIRAFSISLVLFFTSMYVSAEVSLDSAVVTQRAHKSLLLDIVSAGQRMVAVGERGHIIFSDDQGRSWQQANVPTQTLLTAVYFADASYGWAVGHDSTILMSSDGGKNWSLQLSAESTPEVEVGESGSSDTYQEDDYADSYGDSYEDEYGYEDDYVEEPVDRSGSSLMDVWFKNNQQGFVVGSYGYVLSTNDGGKTWLDISSRIDNPDGWHLYSIDADTRSDQVRLFIVGESGYVYRSNNTGQEWDTFLSDYEGSLFGVTVAKKGVVYVYGLQGHVLISEDSAETWREIDTQTSATFNNGFVGRDGSVLLVGNAGAVLHGSGMSLDLYQMQDRRSLVSAIANGINEFVFVGQGGVVQSSLDAMAQ